MAFYIRSFAAVLCVLTIIVGVVGYGLGVIFMQPYYLATGHTVLYALSLPATIIGPILVISGTLLYIIFHRPEHRLEKERSSSE
jgi:hypothetical protein